MSERRITSSCVRRRSGDGLKLSWNLNLSPVGEPGSSFARIADTNASNSRMLRRSRCREDARTAATENTESVVNSSGCSGFFCFSNPLARQRKINKALQQKNLPPCQTTINSSLQDHGTLDRNQSSMSADLAVLGREDNRYKYNDRLADILQELRAVTDFLRSPDFALGYRHHLAVIQESRCLSGDVQQLRLPADSQNNSLMLSRRASASSATLEPVPLTTEIDCSSDDILDFQCPQEKNLRFQESREICRRCNKPVALSHNNANKSRASPSPSALSETVDFSVSESDENLDVSAGEEMGLDHLRRLVEQQTNCNNSSASRCLHFWRSRKSQPVSSRTYNSADTISIDERSTMRIEPSAVDKSARTCSPKSTVVVPDNHSNYEPEASQLLSTQTFTTGGRTTSHEVNPCTLVSTIPVIDELTSPADLHLEDDAKLLYQVEGELSERGEETVSASNTSLNAKVVAEDNCLTATPSVEVPCLASDLLNVLKQIRVYQRQQENLKKKRRMMLNKSRRQAATGKHSVSCPAAWVSEPNKCNCSEARAKLQRPVKFGLNGIGHQQPGNCEKIHRQVLFFDGSKVMRPGAVKHVCERCFAVNRKKRSKRRVC